VAAGLTRIATMRRVSLAPLIIVNPAAGGGRALRSVGWLRERLAARPEARLEITRRPGDAEAMASDAGRLGHDRVIAVGGDGTVQEVVNGLLSASEPTSLGVVPLGSGNDLARSLGLPTDPGAAWGAAIGHATRAIDVAHARNGVGAERWFASAGGVGFDAQVAAAMATRSGWQGGRAGYLLTTLAELGRFENRRVRISIDGATATHDVLFVAIANGAYYGGGMHIAPGAQPDDGRLDVCVVGDISRLTALRELRNLYRGTHVRNAAVSMHTARTIEVEGDARTRLHLDGEPFGGLPLRVILHHGVLRVAARD
jgi:diacylglycerol kinase (ATP)